MILCEPVRIAIINKSTNNKCWWGCGERGALVRCWWECGLVQPLWKTVWNFLKKLKIELPYDLEIPFLNTYPKKTKTLTWEDICTPTFITASFVITKLQKPLKCPSMSKCIKMWYINIQYYSAIKNKILLL